jgi:hypothetical protein
MSFVVTSYTKGTNNMYQINQTVAGQSVPIKGDFYMITNTYPDVLTGSSTSDGKYSFIQKLDNQAGMDNVILQLYKYIYAKQKYGYSSQTTDTNVKTNSDLSTELNSLALASVPTNFCISIDPMDEMTSTYGCLFGMPKVYLSYGSGCCYLCCCLCCLLCCILVLIGLKKKE